MCLVRAGIVLLGLFAAALFAQDAPKPPAGGTLLFTAHASGYQVYGCEANGEWSKSEPVAALVTDKGEILRHYRDKSPAVPTWEAGDGSKAHALLVDGKPDQSVASAAADSIPQLGLKVMASGGYGRLGGVVYVIRRKTEGGNHPAGACKLEAGSRVGVFYRAEYDFYSK